MRSVAHENIECRPSRGKHPGRRAEWWLLERLVSVLCLVPCATVFGGLVRGGLGGAFAWLRYEADADAETQWEEDRDRSIVEDGGGEGEPWDVGHRKVLQ